MEFFSMINSEKEETSALEIEHKEEDTETSMDQEEVEHLVMKAMNEHFLNWMKTGQTLILNRPEHLSYLNRLMTYMPQTYENSDSSQVFLIYWILHSIALLNGNISESHKKSLIKLIASCQSKTGGFGGGPYQLPHLVTTYAAINSLCLLQTDEALAVINRKALIEWIISLKNADGSFCLYENGEVDIRGSYCAAAVLNLLGLDISGVFDGCSEWVAKCQTYEGGFGGKPELEAHVGYTFCGLASLVLLEKVDLIDIHRLTYWAARKQMKIEGGFQGRTNKLVDSCYSFWAGALFPLIEHVFYSGEEKGNRSQSNLTLNQSLFQHRAVQEFLLAGCQKSGHCVNAIYQESSFIDGGMMDRPSSNSNLYNTCYALSGLSVAQGYDEDVVGGVRNALHPINILFNLPQDVVVFANNYFYGEKSDDNDSS